MKRGFIFMIVIIFLLLASQNRLILASAQKVISTPSPGFLVFLPYITNGSPRNDMVFIPAGSFRMGCDPAHNGGNTCFSSDILHTIYLDAYFIDKTEVTNSKYSECVAANACKVPSFDFSRTRPWYFSNFRYSNYPVIHITWNDAINFCFWSGKRLPTEAEWEKAARGSSEPRAFPWGDQAPNCDLAN